MTGTTRWPLSRGAVVALLVVAELAIAQETFVVLRGTAAPLSFGWSNAVATRGPALAEGGPARTFTVGFSPTVTVDIGYADLTVRTAQGPQVRASLSGGGPFSGFGAARPISAFADGTAVRITTPAHRSSGDNRMVTLVVPPSTRLDVVRAGDVTVDGLRADATIHAAGSGDVEISDFRAPSLRVVVPKGTATLRDVAAPRLEVTSAERIDATDVQAFSGTIESTGSRVTLAFAPGSDTLVTAEEGSQPVRTVRVGLGTGRLTVAAGDGNVTLTPP